MVALTLPSTEGQPASANAVSFWVRAGAASTAVLFSLEAQLRQILTRRIMILDGAMGTIIQRYKLSEEDYRGGPGGRFIDFAGAAGADRNAGRPR